MIVYLSLNRTFFLQNTILLRKKFYMKGWVGSGFVAVLNILNTPEKHVNENLKLNNKLIKFLKIFDVHSIF